MNKFLLALAFALAAVGAQAQPNRISGAGGGGCTTNCTVQSLTATGTTPFNQTVTNAAGTASGTILQAYGNTNNMFGDGPGTDTLVGLGAGANLDPQDYLTTAVGWHALGSSTQANTESTAIGWAAQRMITTGGMNTSLGVNTIGSCLVCVHDMAFGTDAMRNTLTASYNIGIGVSALINDGSNGSNIAIGDNAYPGDAGATGQFNIVIGNSAFSSAALTTANQNIMIGQSAGGPSVTSANSDVGIGHLVFQNLTTAANDVAIGLGAGKGVTTGSLNTLVGSQSGYGITTGSQNTIIGAVPNASLNEVTTAIGVIALGYNAVPVNATQNQSINIGNTYYANAQTPNISSGFGTSPSVPQHAGSAAFTVNVGTGGTASSGVISMAVQPNGYICSATDITNPASFVVTAIGTSTTQVTFANYSRTTGASAAWTASDVLAVQCAGY